MVKTSFSLITTNDSDSEHTKKVRKPRRPQVYVTDNMRLQLLLMITEFGLSCYQTAKILNLPYTNAKVIYRVFREEKRIISYSKNVAKSPAIREDYQLL